MKYTKALIAVASAGLIALAQALPEYSNEVSVALAVLGAIGVYLFPNAPQPPDNEPLQRL